MRKRRTKLLAVVLSLCTAASLCACADSTGETSGSASATENGGGDGAISKDSPYYGKGYDLSDPVTVIMYVLGDEPKDMQKVMKEANSKYFEPNLNTTLEVKFLNWSDYQTKYSLLLSGGEQVDLMYTAAWCYYNEEAAKGAFLELDQEFIEKYLPYSWEEQPEESWQQVSISGKMYAVPKGKAVFNSYNLAAVRSDLIEKYSLAEPTNWDNFKSYLTELAKVKDETGVTALNTNANRDQLLSIYMNNNKMEAVASGYDWYYCNNDKEDAPSAEDIYYLYASDTYKNYCLEMAELASQGVWSKDAINDTADAQAYFENGTSGTFCWNSSVYQAGKNLEDSGNGTYAVYDITPDALRRRGSYGDDATAITSSSKNPERAALTLDYMKSDVNLNRLLLGGIEGEHWELTEDGYRKTLDAAENYAWNGWAWAINRADEPDETGIDERQMEMDTHMDSKEYHPVTAGFTFDPSNVETEYTILESVVAEYEYSFSLGIYGDQTEATFEKFKENLENSGLRKVTDELLSQYQSFLANLEK